MEDETEGNVTHFGGSLLFKEIAHDRRCCMEYVVTSPKFSFKRWLLLTTVFNIIGFILNLHTQVSSMI